MSEGLSFSGKNCPACHFRTVIKLLRCILSFLVCHLRLSFSKHFVIGVFVKSSSHFVTGAPHFVILSGKFVIVAYFVIFGMEFSLCHGSFTLSKGPPTLSSSTNFVIGAYFVKIQMSGATIVCHFHFVFVKNIRELAYFVIER